jgi:hypothetical protein
MKHSKNEEIISFGNHDHENLMREYIIIKANMNAIALIN